MKKALGVGLMLAVMVGIGTLGAGPGRPQPKSDWQLLPPIVHQQVQQVVVLDAQRGALAVYHISLNTGEIRLKAVRRIVWDLELENFNGSTPLPREVKTLIETPGQVGPPIRGN